jgi:hypothetical protein
MPSIKRIVKTSKTSNYGRDYQRDAQQVDKTAQRG